MSNPFRTRLHVGGLDARITPSASSDTAPAFTGLEVAVEQYPVDSCSPVFVRLGGVSVDATLQARAGRCGTRGRCLRWSVEP